MSHSEAADDGDQIILDGLEQAAKGRPVREVIRGREIDWRLKAKILTDEWMSGQLAAFS